MNTQNTPVHIKLWHKDFWLMALANMFLAMSVYILIPTMPIWMYGNGLSSFDIGCVMGGFGAGVFIFGGFCSYLVQKFRRNHVCLLAIFAVLLCLGFFYYTRNNCLFSQTKWILIAFRVLLGAFFGLAQMILTSTLIIDTSESFQRTEANHSATWFSRFALSLGPMVALILYKVIGFGGVLIGAMVCAALAMLLIKMVYFPFRAPADSFSVCCLDRFFLPQGKWLFINFTMIATVIGLLLSMKLSYVFYGMMMVGFFIALLAQKFVFENAELKSEIITGLILIGAALLIMLNRKQMVVYYISPVFIGLGIGIIASRFLLFFIKLSKHCQRGTSQSTYILSWELGLSLGLFLGYTFLVDNVHILLSFAIGITVLSLLLYNFFTHKWYMKHKNR